MSAQGDSTEEVIANLLLELSDRVVRLEQRVNKLEEEVEE